VPDRRGFSHFMVSSLASVSRIGRAHLRRLARPELHEQRHDEDQVLLLRISKSTQGHRADRGPNEHPAANRRGCHAASFRENLGRRGLDDRVQR